MRGQDGEGEQTEDIKEGTERGQRRGKENNISYKRCAELEWIRAVNGLDWQ